MRKKPLTQAEIEEVSEAYWEARRAEGEALVEKMKLERELAPALRMHPVSWVGSASRGIVRRSEAKARQLKKQAERLNKVRRCGAKTRKGTPCQCQPEPGMDRCKLHGGKSTGPRSEAGREAIRESNRRRAEVRRAAQAR